MRMNYVYAGRSNVGTNSPKNEDYIKVTELDKENDILFAMVADGTANKDESRITPAAMVCEETLRVLRRTYREQPEWFMENPQFFLNEAFQTANRILGSMQIANEMVYGSAGASATACLLFDDGRMAIAHAGNTRLYRIRPKVDGLVLRQATRDHTEAQEKVDTGEMKPADYYFAPERFILTNGLGNLADPEITVSGGKVVKGDILLLTSDGVHYTLTPDNIVDIIQAAGRPDAAVDALLEAIKSISYPDDASAIIIFLGDDKKQEGKENENAAVQRKD